MSNSLLVRPVCKSKIAVKSKTPTLAQNVVSRDSAIVVTFNTMIDKESFFFTNDELNKIIGESGGICKYSDSEGNCYAYKYDWDENGETVTYKNIKITSSNQNYLKYFGTVEVVDTILSVKTNPSVFIPIENTSVVLDVEISSDIKSVDGINIEASEKWQYKVDSSTIAKCQVNMALDSNITDDVILEGDGIYSVGDSFVIKAPIPANSNYEFSHWSYDDTKIVVANDENSSTRAIVIASSDSPIEIKAICKLKTKVNISLDSRVTDDAVLKGNGFYAVGENFDIEAQISAASNYEFSYWYCDESKVKIDDKNASSTKAVVMESSDTPVEIKAICILKASYDTKEPVIKSLNIEKHNYSDRYIPLTYSPVSTKPLDEWETDEDCQQNFPTEKKLKITGSVYDEGCGIKSIELCEQMIRARDGSQNIKREIIRKIKDEEITKNYDEEGNLVYNFAVDTYELQSDGEGAVDLKFTVTDNANNQSQQKVTVIKIDNFFTQDSVIVTNEPEIWRRDEFNVFDPGEHSLPVTIDNRVNGKFDSAWFNEQIKTFRWAFRLYKDFNLPPSEYFTKIDGTSGSERIDGTSDCYNLVHEQKCNNDLIFENGGSFTIFASKNNGSQQISYKVYVPKPGKIKAITEKRYPEPLYFGNINIEGIPKTKGFFFADNYDSNGGMANTKTFMLDELEPITNDNHREKINAGILYENYFWNREYSYYDKTYYDRSYTGIENGMMYFYVGETNVPYSWAIEDQVFHTPNAKFIAFNYYGELYRSYRWFEYNNYGEYPTAQECTYLAPTHRILGKTGDAFDYDENQALDSTLYPNSEELKIKSWTYSAAPDLNSTCYITFELEDSHIKGSEDDYFDFVVVKEGTSSSAIYDSNRVVGIAEKDLKTGKITGKLNARFMGRTDIYFVPYRMVVKGNKSNIFKGTISYQDGSTETNGRETAEKSNLYYDCNVLRRLTYGREVVDYYALGVGCNATELYPIEVISSKYPLPEYTASYYIMEVDQKMFMNYWYGRGETFPFSFYETKFQNGEYKPAAVTTKGLNVDTWGDVSAVNSSYSSETSVNKYCGIGLPLEDLQNGYYFYQWAVTDSNGNSTLLHKKGNASHSIVPVTQDVGDKYSMYGFELFNYEYGTRKTPIYDFSSTSSFNINLGNETESVFYKMESNQWNYVTADELRTNCIGKNNTGWVKYITIEKNGDDGFRSTAWNYAYLSDATETEPSVMEQQNGLMINGETPVLCYVVASSRNRDITGEDWEYRPKYIGQKVVRLSETQDFNIYTYKKDEIPDGWYYKICLRYAQKNPQTGKTELKLWQSDLRQK